MDPPGLGDGRAAQARIAFPDLAQRPVDGLPHEITFVGRLAADDRQKTKKHVVRQLLAVHGQSGHEHETAAIDEFGPAPAPRVRLLDCHRRAIKQHAAAGIGRGPVVAFPRPSVHLPAGDLARVIGQRRDDPRLLHPGRPQGQRQWMVAPVGAGDLPQDRRPDSKVLALRRDPEAALPGDVAWVALCTQLRNDRRGGFRGGMARAPPLPHGAHESTWRVKDNAAYLARRARTASASCAKTGTVCSNGRHGSVTLRP
ncbi:MAG: hypothetical protein A3G75_00295 [Verrucomicrobia bacterium RIFCSPLOWO2_12_FULL_64_8]|nr:MAG: hypothetical protein A3G75_00295 [Verrucomicrobia bacterium RIFCSPLOWO2_12_FULL_64_8]